MPTVGLGYATANKAEKSFSIFGTSLEEKTEFTTSFNFSFNVFRNLADFRDNFKFTAELAMPFSSAASLNSALEVSGSLAVDQDFLIYVMHILGVRKQIRAELRQEKFAKDSQFQKTKQELHDVPLDFCSKYGDAFVSKVLYGGEIAFVIKFRRNAIETKQTLIDKLQSRLLGSINLELAIALLKEIVYEDLDCDIYTQVRGLSSDQLPSTEPEKFMDLAVWLSQFAQKFNDIPAESFHTSVGFEIMSYETILPEETVALMEESQIRARYFFTISRCRDVINFYTKYYQWAGDQEGLEKFQIKRLEIENIKKIFDIKQDMHSSRVAKPISDLKRMVTELNAVAIPPKLLNVFSSKDFGRNLAGGMLRKEQRISTPFQMPALPEDLIPDTFTFEVSKAKGSKPIVGNLSLLYSFDRNVPFDDASREIARHVNIDSLNNSATLPAELSDAHRLSQVTFAYHLERGASLSASNFPCLRPCAKTKEEDFEIKTYMRGKRQAPILPMDS